MATHKTNISLHTLTQEGLDKITRAFPRAKQVLAFPETAKEMCLYTLEMEPSIARLIDAAARRCGVDRARFMMNCITGIAEAVLPSSRVNRILATGREAHTHRQMRRAS
jgi:hypothetical protein